MVDSDGVIFDESGEVWEKLRIVRSEYLQDMPPLTEAQIHISPPLCLPLHPRYGE